MNRKNIVIVFLIFLLCGTIGLIVTMSKIDKLEERETTEFVATVTDVKTTNTGKNLSAEIYTKEYDAPLYVSNSVCNRIGVEAIDSLKVDETIFFRIEKIKKAQMNKVAFISIVSLRTDSKSIFALEEYNNFMHISAKPARMASIIVAGGCFLLLFYFLRQQNKIR